MSFSREHLTRDAFLGGRIALWQPRTGYRAATDPVLLAAFTPVRPGEAVLELGCGAGTAALCLLARVPRAAVHGIELQPGYAELARRNAEENGLALAVHEGDLANMPAALRAMRFDHVIANPPFHAAGTRPRDPGRAGSHAEVTPLAVWLDAGLRRLRPGGTLTLIHRTDRLGAILAALEGRAAGTEILPLAAREGRPAERVLLRARKGSRSPLLLHSPFTLHSGSGPPCNAGRYTRAAEGVLRDMLALLPSTRLGSI